MKKIFLYSALMIGFAACGDNDDNNTPTPAPVVTTKVQLKENGTAVTLDYQASWSYSSTDPMYGLGITQNKTGTEAPQRKMFLINIHGNNLTIGSTHNIGAGNENEIIYLANHSSTRGQYKANKNFEGSHGTFTLTKITDLGSNRKAFYGTFNGTVINIDGDSLVLTNGQILE